MDTLRRWYRDVPVTTLATLAAVVVWTITAAQSGSISNSLAGSSLAESWLLWGPYVSTDGMDWFRALGAVFLHIDAGHLAINCAMLALIGREIERHLGTALYAAVFLTGGIGASAAVLWLDYDAPTAGASGVVFALMALLVGVNRLRGGDLRAPLVLIAVNVAYTFLAANVSLWGHLGGLLCGLLMMMLVFQSRREVRWGGVLALLVVACALVVAV